MVKVLTLWIDDICQIPVSESLARVEIVDISTDDLMELMNNPVNPVPPLIVAGQPPEGLPLLEAAQTINLVYPSTPALFVTSNKNGFNRTAFVKNGFYEAFLIPFETAEFQAKTAELLARAHAVPTESFRTVKLLDFQGSEPLEFDTFIYLPLRGKHIRYTHAGKELDPEQIKRLKTHEVNSLHIRQADMKKFYQFTAQQLMNIGRNQTMSETERQDKLASAVREVVSGVFTETGQAAGFDAGRKLMTDCQEIVKSYVMASNDQSNSLYERISAIAANDSGTYAQATNVATFGSLFSIGLSIGKPDEIAMAGLLCDIGLAELPAELQIKKPEERTPEEEKMYQLHPELSVNLLKSKRMIIPEKVTKIIQQHHENFNGKGYPKELPGDRILPEAQIVALAVDFSELIVTKPGRKRMTPREALEHIKKNEAGKRFSAEFLNKVFKMLFGNQAKAAS